MLTRCKKIVAAMTAATLLTIHSGIVLAQNHSHSHGEEKHAQLTLNDGKKWGTDKSVRQGMSRIRNTMAAALPAIHSGKTTAGQYLALARKMNDQITLMVKNCKLDQQADTMLHLVLAEIIAGTDAMMVHDGSDPHKGAEKIVHALDNYGAYFDHPGWHGIMSDH